MISAALHPHCHNRIAAKVPKLKFLVAGLPITELDIARTAVSDAGILVLSDLPLLNCLDIFSGVVWGGILTNAGLVKLRGLQLTALKMWNQAMITDEGILELRNMPLAILDLTGCCSISNVGLGFTQGMPLISLNISGCSDLSDISVLQGLPLTCLNLKYLSESLAQSFHVVRDMPLVDLVIFSRASDASLEA